jgi:cytochrome P450
LDLARKHNPQLGLGYGTHSCLGTALVRTIAGAALDEVFTRWPDTTLAVPQRDIVWRSGFRHRGPLTLPVELG